MSHEKGFYHPERGYWQTTGAPPARIIAGYPEGTVEVPLKPGADHQWVGGQDGAWVYVEPPFDAQAVSAECRTRIIAVLDTYTVQNIQGAFMVGDLTAAQEATFKAGRDWVAAMQTACRQAAIDEAEPLWPPVPEGVADLAALF